MSKYAITMTAFMLGLTSMACAKAQECNMYVKFETAQETGQWRAVNDGVMGGKSSGGPRFENGNMIFEGVINTNGGGFSSLRSPVDKGDLKDASAMTLRVKSDGRAYKLTFRTDMTYRGRLISFQAPIPQTPKGEWAEISVPFSDLSGSIFGRSLQGAKFDRAQVQEMGIILADDQDGPFQLEVDWMRDC
ncbi:CIA30 family protein [Hellea sp.]|nr:CIA30 family protein [Hellea sp.]